MLIQFKSSPILHYSDQISCVKMQQMHQQLEARRLATVRENVPIKQDHGSTSADSGTISASTESPDRPRSSELTAANLRKLDIQADSVMPIVTPLTANPQSPTRSSMRSMLESKLNNIALPGSPTRSVGLREMRTDAKLQQLNSTDELRSALNESERSRFQVQKALDSLIKHQESVQEVLQELVHDHKKLKSIHNVALDQVASLREEGTRLYAQLEDANLARENAEIALERQVKEDAELREEAQEQKISTARQHEYMMHKQSSAENKTIELEAKIADMNGERHQLREKIRQLEKSLERMKWPTPEQSARSRGYSSNVSSRQNTGSQNNVDASGSTSNYHVGGSAVDKPDVNMFSFPRAPNANVEADFNIFTGAPKGNKRNTGQARSGIDTPTTRMSWKTSDTTVAAANAAVAEANSRSEQARGFGRLGPGYDAFSSPYEPKVSSLPKTTAGSPMSKAPVPPSAVAADFQSEQSIRELLADRLRNAVREQLMLETDIAKGNFSEEAQSKALSRISTLSSEAAEIRHALNLD